MLVVLGCRPPSLAPGGSRLLCLLARRLRRDAGGPLRPVAYAVSPIPVPVVAPQPRSARRALGTKPSSPPFPSTGRPGPSRPKGLQPGGPPQPPQPLMPARLLIYHASTARITFLACLRLGTLFICVFFCLAVAPAYLRGSGGSEALLKAGAAVLSGLVPFVFVYLSTSPFVAFIHLPIPPFARQSKELLKRFAASVPDTTSLDVTTISLVGKPRVTRVPVASLAPARERFGIVNYVIRPGPASLGQASSARALLSRPPTKFSIQHNSIRDAREAWVWDSIAAAVSRRCST